MTPKQRVLKRYPRAELIRDGWYEKAGLSGCYDFGVFWGEIFLGQGPSPQAAWKAASRHPAIMGKP